MANNPNPNPNPNPFNRDEVNKKISQLKELQDITDTVNGNLSSWGKSFKEINKVQKEIVKVTKQISKLDDEIANTSDDRKKDLELAKKELEEEIKLLEDKVSLVERERSLMKSIRNEMKERTKETIKEITRTTQQYIQQNFSLGSVLNYLTDIDDQIRKTNLAIGGTEKGYDNIRMSLESSAGYLARIGVSLSDAAQYQRILTESTGRAFTLNEDNVKSIGRMTSATGLQAEIIGGMLADMDLFGRGVRETELFVEETLNMANKMGLNGIAVTKKIAENLKRAQQFFFKGGQDKGLQKMVMLSEKFKLNIESAFSFADKVQNIQGAVETAAQLQVLGGSFARLGNPFELLYQSRNDMVGLTESLVKMTDNIATFDAQSKTFKISAMELQRLKAAAEITGFKFEDLTEQALEFARISKAGNEIGFFTNKEDRDMIAKMAKMREDGSFEISFMKGGKQITEALSKLSSGDLKYIRETNKSLEERATQAMGFNDTLKSVTEELKATLLPLLKGINESLINFRSFRDTLFGKDGDNFATKLINGGLIIAAAAPVLLSFAGTFLSGIGRLLGGGLLNMIGSKGAMATASTVGKGGIFSTLFGGMNLMKGVAAIAIVTASIWGLSKAFQEMGKVDWKSIDVGKMGLMIGGFLGIVGVLGAISSTGVGTLGIIAGLTSALSIFVGMSLTIKMFAESISMLGSSFSALSMGIQSLDTSKLKVVLDSIGSIFSQSTKSFGDVVSEKLFGSKIEGIVSPIVELSKIDGEKLKTISNLFAQSQGKPLIIKMQDDINIKFDELKVNINGETSVINDGKIKQNIKEQLISSLSKSIFLNENRSPTLNGRGV
jgi:hypothetical protein